MALNEIVRVLPYSLRENFGGYLDFIDAMTDELFVAHDAPPPSQRQREAFLTLVAAWKLWRSIDTQFWLLSNSLNVLSTSGANQFAIGRRRYSRESDTYGTLLTLRDDLRRTLNRLDLSFLTTVGHVADLIDHVVSVT